MASAEIQGGSKNEHRTLRKSAPLGLTFVPHIAIMQLWGTSGGEVSAFHR
nr:MAG TPA: hypothetical protein [Bacteriophage sp.]